MSRESFFNSNKQTNSENKRLNAERFHTGCTSELLLDEGSVKSAAVEKIKGKIHYYQLMFLLIQLSLTADHGEPMWDDIASMRCRGDS